MSSTERENPLRTIATATHVAAGEKTVPAALLYIVAMIAVILDQAVKIWASANLKPVGTMPILPKIFYLTYAQNTGMAFSLLQGKQFLLVAAAALVIVGIVIAQRRIGTRVPTMLAISLGMALGGALGNAMDRVRLGYVVDLFDLRCINFPIFNVADTAITIGIVLLAWRVAFAPVPAEPQKISSETA